MSAIETLTCGICGEDFQRERKRGVKPSSGPCCSSVSAAAVRAIRAFQDWVKMDKEIHLARAAGTITFDEYSELKALNVMPDYDTLPDNDVWVAARALNLV